jgi:antitoxin Phd
MKDGRPWVTIQPASSHVDPVDVAVDFMNEYADVFEGLSR